MKPLTGPDGNIQTKSTKGETHIDHSEEVEGWEPPKTKRAVYYQYPTPHGTKYYQAYDYEREAETEQILYEVVGEGIEEGKEMTEQQAKIAFSSRQVRKALKRLPREMKYQLKGKRRKLKTQYDPQKVIMRDIEDANQDVLDPEDIMKIQQEHVFEGADDVPEEELPDGI
mgnify:CR=1 FL=1